MSPSLPIPARPAPPWWAAHAVWWHVYPLGFVGAEAVARPAEAGVAHRLEHIEAWLDYAVELGCSGLALGPIFASETHGYDTVDHLRIDARLGDDADFDHLVTAVHERGLRLLLDGVFNHVGRGFGPLADVIRRGDASPWSAWFTREDTPTGFVTFEGHAALVKLNHENDAVADHVVAVMDHWLGRGADGWRLDAAYAVPRPFWRAVLDRVRPSYPDAWFVGEVIHGDYRSIVAETAMDSVTQYELWKAIWSSCREGNLHELAWAFTRHNEFLSSFAPLTFVGNHDVTRIASQIADRRHLAHALVILFTVGGTPSIYAGDEQGFVGIKEERAGGDDVIRPAFPMQPTDLAPHGWPIYRLHQDLVGLRRRHPWLHRSTTMVTVVRNEAMAYACHGPDGADQWLDVVLNLGDAPFTAPVTTANGAGPVVLAGVVDGVVGAAPASVTVPPHGWAVIGPSPRGA